MWINIIKVSYLVKNYKLGPTLKYSSDSSLEENVFKDWLQYESCASNTKICLFERENKGVYCKDGNSVKVCPSAPPPP